MLRSPWLLRSRIEICAADDIDPDYLEYAKLDLQEFFQVNPYVRAIDMSTGTARCSICDENYVTAKAAAT